jgi:hypothetical protein
MKLLQTAPGRYEGTFVPQVEGAYVMRLTGSMEGEELVALTTGWVMGYSPEYASLEGDPTYLAGLAEVGGGGVLVEPADAIAHNIRGAGVRRDLWPYLLALATVLLPFDVGVRRLALGRHDFVRIWEWVMARLPGRRPVAEAPSPVGRLFQAKARIEDARRVDIHRSEAQRPAAEIAPPKVAPSPIERPREPPAPRAPAKPGQVGAEGETLAGRLLRKKQTRGEDEG